MDDEISPEAVEELLTEENPPHIVDIRSPDAFARGHIPGSENVPFAELPDRVESLSDADRIVTVCPQGQASVQAARLIKSFEGTASARVESMAGGLNEWTGEFETGEDDSAAEDAPDAPF